MRSSSASASARPPVRVLAVDTEFLRERTYRPRLCLIQLATSADDIAAVDPIAIRDLSPIARLFEDPSIVKILHACSQDLEVIDGAMGCVPSPMFDTQLAAAFLGHRMQLGYGALVESYTGVHLAKAESLTDWSRRPLDPEQLVYAEDDVRYLPGIYEQMRSELVSRDRLSMVLPEMQALLDPSHYRHDPMACLPASQARELAHQASARGGSRGVRLAREACGQARHPAQVGPVRRGPRRGLSSRARRRAKAPAGFAAPSSSPRGTRAALLHAISRGLSCPASNVPERAEALAPVGRQQESVVDRPAHAMLRIISERSGVATQLIATRDELLDFMSGEEGASLSQGWRYELAGRQLEGLLSGSCGLTVKDGRVEILSPVPQRPRSITFCPVVTDPSKSLTEGGLMYYGYGMGYDPMYLLLIVVSTILGMATQGYIKSTYAKWSKVPLDSSLTGADVARRMLADEGVSGVGIEAIGGELTDNYDPRSNVLHLSQGNLRGGSVASAAVACHEAGHAVQHARGYAPVRIRSALVPVVNFTSNAWMIAFFLGIAMGAAGLMRFAIALFAFSVIFQIVTLPVEFDASRRAVAYVERSGLGPQAVRGAKKVLVAAALTYVAAALVSVLQLLYYLSKTDRRGER